MEDLDDRGIKSHPYWEADPSRNPGGHGKGPGGRQDLLLVCMNGFRMNNKIKMVKVDLCINTMRWERAMLEEGAGLAHCPKTTWSLPGSGLHEQK